MPLPVGIFEESELQSLSLEALAGEFQLLAVLGDGAYHVVRCAGWDLGFDLQRYADAHPDEAVEMGDDLVCDAAGVAAHPSLVQQDRAVVPLRLRWWRYDDRAGAWFRSRTGFR